jgi:hypothetical protein
MRTALTLIFCCLILTGFSQEELRNLDFAPGYKAVKHKKSLEGDSGIIYLYDTLELPFIDDFSRNRNKNVRLNIGDLGVIDSVFALFKVDGEAPDTAQLRKDTTYFVIETSPGVFDTLPYMPLEVVFFDSTKEYLPVDTQLFWQIDREIMLGSTTYTEFLPPDTTLFNHSIICHYALDDPISYWVNEGAFRNNTFGVNPPTVGVMTFDGLDRLGVPYDFSSSGTYGDADFLTSKPINLGEKSNGQPYTAQDSIYFSFYYQPQGLGNDPEPEDSLSLNFYSPVTDKWYWIWAAAGDSIQNFRKVNIAINDTLFLQKGFRMRFRNKATLSGSLDHWNIDYVAIVANARVLKGIFADVGYYGETPSYIKTYTSMPWKHFKRNPAKYMIPEVQIPIKNLSLKDDRFLENRFAIRKLGDTTRLFLSNKVTVTNLPKNTDLTINVPVYNNSPSFTFPLDNNERASFQVTNFFEINPDENRDNDTMYHFQYFDTYYAYDDGVGELAYSLNGTGARLAYEFETDGSADTLRAILVNFPRMLLNEKNRKINIMVWTDLSKDPVYESGPVWEVDYPNLNDFKRYAIDVPVVVSGKYYIGWQQQDSRKIYVGWDVNKRNEERLFYSLDGSWTPTSFEGSLMLRPDFGYAQISASVEEKQIDKNFRINIYPNPATKEISILADDDLESVSIYDMTGRIMLHANRSLNKRISLQGLGTGIYLVNIKTTDGSYHSEKLRIIND